MLIRWCFGFHFIYLFISLQSFSSSQSGRLLVFQFSYFFFPPNYSWITVIRYSTKINTYILLKWQLYKVDKMQQHAIWPHLKAQYWWISIFLAKLAVLLELKFKDTSMIWVSVIVQHNLFGKYGKSTQDFWFMAM